MNFLYRSLNPEEIATTQSLASKIIWSADEAQISQRNINQYHQNKEIRAVLFTVLTREHSTYLRLLNTLESLQQNLVNFQHNDNQGRYIPQRTTYIMYQAVKWAIEAMPDDENIEKNILQDLLLTLTEIGENEGWKQERSSDKALEFVSNKILSFVGEKITLLNARLNLIAISIRIFDEEFCPTDTEYQAWIDSKLGDGNIISVNEHVQALIIQYKAKQERLVAEAAEAEEKKRLEKEQQEQENSIIRLKREAEPSQEPKSGNLGPLRPEKINKDEKLVRQTIDIMNLPGAKEAFGKGREWVPNFINFIIETLVNEDLSPEASVSEFTDYIYQNVESKLGFKTQSQFRQAYHELAQYTRSLPDLFTFGFTQPNYSDYSDDSHWQEIGGDEAEIACFKDFANVICNYLRELRATSSLSYHQHKTYQNFETKLLPGNAHPSRTIEQIASAQEKLSAPLSTISRMMEEVHINNSEAVSKFETGRSVSYNAKYEYNENGSRRIKTFELVITSIGININITKFADRTFYSRGDVIGHETYENSAENVSIDLHGYIGGSKFTNVGGKNSHNIKAADYLNYLINRTRYLKPAQFKDGSERFTTQSVESFIRSL
jgi:hypothetical protein